jgi:hypothetical protein
MSSILFVEDPMSAKLDAADGPLQVCTRDGRVLGYFTPAKPQKLHLEPPVSVEELDRIENDPNGRWVPASAVEAKLRELRCTK